MEKKCKAMEGDEKQRQSMQKYEEEGKAILENNKPIHSLNATELEKLLLWHNIPKKELGNKSNRKMKWEEIVRNNTAPHRLCHGLQRMMQKFRN